MSHPWREICPFLVFPFFCFSWCLFSCPFGENKNKKSGFFLKKMLARFPFIAKVNLMWIKMIQKKHQCRNHLCKIQIFINFHKFSHPQDVPYLKVKKNLVQDNWWFFLANVFFDLFGRKCEEILGSIIITKLTITRGCSANCFGFPFSISLKWEGDAFFMIFGTTFVRLARGNF